MISIVYLWPLRVELPCPDCVLERALELAALDVRRRPVRVEDVVGRVHGQGLGVEADSRGELARLAGGVGRADLNEKGSISYASGTDKNYNRFDVSHCS